MEMHTKWANAAHFGALQSRDFVQGSTKYLAVSAGRIWDFYNKINENGAYFCQKSTLHFCQEANILSKT